MNSRKFLFYILLIFAVAFAGLSLSPFSREIMLNLGFLTESVSISGTGSMYPTFPKSEGVTDKIAGSQIVAEPKMKRYPQGFIILGRPIFSYTLKLGDIVEFENELTHKISSEKYGSSSGFVKRVIALPGQEIELRDGYVYLNGSVMPEGYTAKPRSTYGGEFLSDCQKLKIPDGYVFIMGDNRKASLDSRFELGLVKISDIHHVISIDNQDHYKLNWRNTSEDQKFAHTSTATPESFVQLLNNIRNEKKLTELKLNLLLNKSTSIRGNSILASDDFSVEATRSGMTLASSIRQAGYRNIILSEFFTRGYFEAEELIENLFEFPDAAKVLLSEEYQDIGLSAVLSEINNCPTQVIVIHFGGYKPPNYQKSDIAGWQMLIDNLTQIIPSWKQLIGQTGINQDKLDSLIAILEERLSQARKIHIRLSQNQWLTDQETQYLNRDKTLHSEAEKLITELNY